MTYELCGRPNLEQIAAIDRGVIPFTRACQNNGMVVNRERLWDLSSYLDKEIAKYGEQITEHVPQSMLDEFTSESMSIDDFNIDSSDQIAVMLFRHLRVGQGVELAMTASGERISTGKKQLERIKKDHPVIPLILQRRELVKLKTTYTETLPKMAIYVPRIDRWKLFYNIGLTFTSTGRMTVSRLHQIPIRTELGRRIRQAFEPEPGMVFISADYSGLELRILAHCARERRMIEIFSDPKGDIHQNTVNGLDMPDSMDATQQRLAAKRVNFGICLKKGQQVLTNVGLIPIEKVTTKMLLWDGIDWVRHGGVVFNGYKEVVTYDGITATPDHKVWTCDGRVLPIAQAMAEGRRIATTAVENNPIRYFADCREDDHSRRSMEARRDYMYQLRKEARREYRQFAGGEAIRLSMSNDAFQRVSSSGLLARTLCDNPTTLRESEERPISELWRSWDREQVRECRRIRGVHTSRAAAPDLQETLYRSYRQRRSLRTREPEALNLRREQPQHAEKCVDQLQGQEDCRDRSSLLSGAGLSELLSERVSNNGTGAEWSSVARDPQTGTAQALGEIAPVYDILDAGPRHRFTIEGKLVSNCYGTTDLGLWLTLQADGVTCTREQCAGFQKNFFDTYVDIAPFIGVQHYRGRRYGFDWNPFGRVTPAPEFRSVHKRIVREGERRIQNWSIQSTATDVFKIGAAEVYDFCLEVGDGLFGPPKRLEPLLPFHDQILSQCDEDIAEECAEAIGQIMGGCVSLRVPLKVDSNIQAECWKK